MTLKEIKVEGKTYKFEGDENSNDHRKFKKVEMLVFSNTDPGSCLFRAVQYLHIYKSMDFKKKLVNPEKNRVKHDCNGYIVKVKRMAKSVEKVRIGYGLKWRQRRSFGTKKKLKTTKPPREEEFENLTLGIGDMQKVNYDKVFGKRKFKNIRLLCGLKEEDSGLWDEDNGRIGVESFSKLKGRISFPAF
ncbi:uncharacterized protein E5676_scaffold494G00490 [Cucumis melo var. makuwa]|uniref:Uncharacterized protein n=1 Tax=Cucumis melo var. makuwa TaxID=1194695 RepID=A0A5D3DEU1_CUCMM|nr:uncharacterized protein E5676_scaffold494G00490 [Cucumis melo var. makuwa]